MIRDDIRRQKKERARQAQIAKRMEEGNDNWTGHYQNNIVPTN